MTKVIVAATATAVAAFFIASPAFADWYVVKEKAGSCRVVDKKPTDTTIVVMGNGKVYKTEKEAQDQVKVVCK